MATVTLSPSAQTYTSKKNPDTGHTGAMALSVTPIPARTADSDTCTAFLEYTIPKAVQYGKVTSAILKLKANSGWSSSSYSSTSPTDLIITSVSLGSWSVDSLTYTMEQMFCVRGDSESTASAASGTNRRIDVTSFLGNITDDKLILGVNNSNGLVITDTTVTGGATYFSYISPSEDSTISLTITYEGSKAVAPSISYPNNTYVREGEAVNFSWVYNSETLAVQKSVELGWKASGASSWNTYNLTQSGYSYNCTDAFPQGLIEWRVKTTNDADETSEYSYASFTVIGKPAVPVITNIENKALTAIEWSASDQCGYEYSLSKDGTVLESGTRYTDSKVLKPNMFLSNGTYSIKLRIKNSTDMWSDWTFKNFTISGLIPTAPDVDVDIVGTTARIYFDAEYGIDYYVIRDGKVIAKTSGEYIDKTLCSGRTYSYSVRAVSESYADSAPVGVSVTYKGFIIASNDFEINGQISSSAFLEFGESPKLDKAVFSCPGREFPVVEFGTTRTLTISRTVVVDMETAELIDALQGEKVFYRDSMGNAYPAVITNLSFSKYRLDKYTAAIQMQRIDSEEVIVNE